MSIEQSDQPGSKTSTSRRRVLLAGAGNRRCRVAPTALEGGGRVERVRTPNGDAPDAAAARLLRQRGAPAPPSPPSARRVDKPLPSPPTAQCRSDLFLLVAPAGPPAGLPDQ